MVTSSLPSSLNIRKEVIVLALVPTFVRTQLTLLPFMLWTTGVVSVPAWATPPISSVRIPAKIPRRIIVGKLLSQFCHYSRLRTERVSSAPERADLGQPAHRRPLPARSLHAATWCRGPSASLSSNNLRV